MKKALIGYHKSNKQVEVNDLGELVSFTPSTLIVETDSENELELAYIWAEQQGFYGLVTIDFDPESPLDFTNAINP